MSVNAAKPEHIVTPRGLLIDVASFEESQERAPRGGGGGGGGGEEDVLVTRN